VNDAQQAQLDHLISLLYDPDPKTRGLVADGLGKIKSVQAVSPLVALLDDNTTEVRIAAIRSLGEIGNFTAVEPLLPLLQDEAASVRTAVLLALTQLPDSRAFAPVVVALFDSDDEVRKNAAATIGRLGDPRAFEPLLVCLKDSYYWVRHNAAWSLGVLHLTQAVPHLLEHLSTEKDEAVLSNTVVALARIGEPEGLTRVLEILQDESQSSKLRISAAIGFGEYFEEQSLSEAKRLDMGGAKDSALEEAVSATLLSLLRTAPDDELRATAAWTLGRLPQSPQAIDALTQVQDDPYEWVVKYATESLAILKGACTVAQTP
jgi:HEAT repeat protein